MLTIKKFYFGVEGNSGYTNICVAKRYKFYIRITVTYERGNDKRLIS